LRSLQVKFSTLIVTVLAIACAALTLVATHHERGALEAEVGERAIALAANLAGAAEEPLLGLEQGSFDDELVLERLVEETGAGDGVVGVRLLARDGRVVASLDADARGKPGELLARADGEPAVDRRGDVLLVGAPIAYSGVAVGEAQVELDLRALVDPVVRGNTRQLAGIAAIVLLLGVVAGTIFVALLSGPLRRLRVGVERLRDGDLAVRVPPTSRDEVGELTRAFNEMGDSLLQKQRIQSAFGRYVNDYVLNQLLEGPDSEALAGMEREVTILFADVRGFTHLSEGLKARAVVSLLKEVFQIASDRILERGGTIDKFIGDSIMAYFGAPVSQPDHVQRAVAAAVDILRRIEDRNRRLRAAGDAAGIPVEIGIGIHTGVVVVGNVGSDRRTDFTVVGDAVNVAHRLEKLSRPGQILVSEAVQRAVRGAQRLRFEGERQLSGRAEPVHVYSVEFDREPPGTASAP
jgi:class 3 adenylate cyclase